MLTSFIAPSPSAPCCRRGSTRSDRAVLEVLAMRVSAGEVRHLIRQLPEELADSVRWNSKGPERFDLDDLILWGTSTSPLASNSAELAAGSGTRPRPG